MAMLLAINRRHNMTVHINANGVPKLEVWQWDGDWEAPTLSPSIQRHGACNWHGHLRAGKFVGV